MLRLRPRRRLPRRRRGARGSTIPIPWIAAAYLVKRDGVVLWAGQPDARLPPASLAKLMTALLALERGKLDEPVTVGRGVLQATGTRIGLKPGEQLRAGDLLAATVVRSANDACRALAEHLGGSVKIFVAEDERARRPARPRQHALRRSLRPRPRRPVLERRRSRAPRRGGDAA